MLSFQQQRKHEQNKLTLKNEMRVCNKQTLSNLKKY